MNKTYTVKPYRIIKNIIFSALGAFVVTLLINTFIGEIYSYIGGALIFLLSLWLLIFDTFLTITINQDQLIVKKGKKIQEFTISESGFRAVMHNAGRSDSSYFLNVISPEGEETQIDCELLGNKQFNELLEDLGVTGEKASATKIETKKN